MTDKQWMPEVGGDCEMQDADGKWVAVNILVWVEGFWVGWVSNSKQIFYSNDLSEFRPISTEADKKRDEQIIKLKLFKLNSNLAPSIGYYEVAEWLYEKGVRAITPDEHVVKRLSTSEKAAIGKKWDGRHRADIIHAVEKAIFGE